LNKLRTARLIVHVHALMREIGMCAACVEIDKRIEHFKMLHGRLLDPQTLQSIEILIEKLEAKKAALHPEEKK
jgi:hypothetical protein